MTKKWVPTSGDFYCPGKMKITADELGITISTGRRALATTEWPSEKFRLCEEAEEPEAAPQIPEEVLEAISELRDLAAEAIPYAGKYFDDKWQLSERFDKTTLIVDRWLDKIKKENT